MVAGLDRMPRHVSEYLLAAGTKKQSSLTIGEVQRRITKYYYEPEQGEMMKSQLKQSGGLKLIGHLTVTTNLAAESYTGTITQHPTLKFSMADAFVEKFPELLLGGVWGSIVLKYDTEENVGPMFLSLEEFVPYQLTGTEEKIQQFCASREHFDLMEWINFLLLSLGYNPEFFDRVPEVTSPWSNFPAGTREKMLMIARLVPLVQSNCHIPPRLCGARLARVARVELGPRGTGRRQVNQ